MTVLTTSRNYNFDLKVMTAERCPTTQAIYSLSFDYPSEPLRLAETPAGQPSVVVDPKEAAEATSKEPHPKDADSQLPEAKAPSRPHNTGYSFEGDAANVPLRVFDDGRTTYFQWAEGASAPAIYAIDPAGAKALVNYTFAGDKIAVDQIAPQFELRRGKAVTHLFNDGYAAPALDGASPRPRKAQRRRFLGLF
jgi:type IV secretion system protein VirB9